MPSVIISGRDFPKPVAEAVDIGFQFRGNGLGSKRDKDRILGVVHLKDIVKEGLKDRFTRLPR